MYARVRFDLLTFVVIANGMQTAVRMKLKQRLTPTRDHTRPDGPSPLICYRDVSSLCSTVTADKNGCRLGSVEGDGMRRRHANIAHDRERRRAAVVSEPSEAAHAHIAPVLDGRGDCSRRVGIGGK